MQSTKISVWKTIKMSLFWQIFWRFYCWKEDLYLPVAVSVIKINKKNMRFISLSYFSLFLQKKWNWVLLGHTESLKKIYSQFITSAMIQTSLSAVRSTINAHYWRGPFKWKVTHFYHNRYFDVSSHVPRFSLAGFISNSENNDGFPSFIFKIA